MLIGASMIRIKTSRRGTMVHGGLCKLCLGGKSRLYLVQIKT